MTKSEASVINKTFKVVLNATYGVMGSKYDKLFNPKTLLQVTITGQLTMLMLIERLSELKCVKVVASNTDSVTYVTKKGKCKKKAEKIVRQIEKESKLTFDFEEFKAIHMRDINSYIAVYDGYVKSKGFYGEETLSKNPEHPIVQQAIRTFLLDGTPMEETIRDCKDPAKFCISRTVRGGAIWSNEEYPNSEEYEKYIKKVPFKQNKALEKRNDNHKKQFLQPERDYLGKVIRYYYSTEGKPAYYKGSLNKVAKSDGCKPMMQLKKKIPKDLNYDRYIELANTYLKELGYE